MSKTGKRIIISISKTRKTNANKKNWSEYALRLFFKGVKPHSKGDLKGSEITLFFLTEKISTAKMILSVIAINV